MLATGLAILTIAGGASTFSLPEDIQFLLDEAVSERSAPAPWSGLVSSRPSAFPLLPNDRPDAIFMLGPPDTPNGYCARAHQPGRGWVLICKLELPAGADWKVYESTVAGRLEQRLTGWSVNAKTDHDLAGHMFASPSCDLVFVDAGPSTNPIAATSNAELTLSFMNAPNVPCGYFDHPDAARSRAPTAAPAPAP